MSDERVITVDDGAEIWTATSGSGPGLALCHGGPGWFDYLEPVAEMVDDLLTVHRWDQRGAGRSSSIGPYSISRSVDDLEALRRAFGHERWFVGGHSWGASLALHYALAYPGRTRALVYMCGTGLAWARWRASNLAEEEARRTPEEHDRFLFLEEKERTEDEEREYLILNDVPNYGDRTRARDLAERSVDATMRYPLSYEVNAILMRETRTLDEAAMVAKCATLDVPVLVVDAEEDPRPAAAVDSLVQALPNCTRVSLPRVGHMPWIEDDTSLRNALREFFAKD